MFWCWERKKAQTRNEVADDGQIEQEMEAQKDPLVRSRQVFPDGYKSYAIRKFAQMSVGVNLLKGQTRGHIAWYVNRLRNGRPKYEGASTLTGIPWEIIGVLHGLESSFNFDKQILNGQKWWKVTNLVPRGLGPWANWEESCVAGFRHELKHNPMPIEWSVEATALFLERWNGMGYWRMKRASPYLWSYTSVQEQGKYVSDGRYDRNAVSKQVGGMAMLKEVGFFG